MAFLLHKKGAILDTAGGFHHLERIKTSIKIPVHLKMLLQQALNLVLNQIGLPLNLTFNHDKIIRCVKKQNQMCETLSGSISWVGTHMLHYE